MLEILLHKTELDRRRKDNAKDKRSVNSLVNKYQGISSARKTEIVGQESQNIKQASNV
jgi:hypothetical protein